MMFPRIFHSIWLGPGEPPDDHRRLLRSWQEFHPDWEVQRWTKTEIAAAFPDVTAADSGFDRTGSAALKVRILRAAGGIILDPDLECLENVEPLLDGIQAFLCYERHGEISRSLLRGAPGHPLFEAFCRSLEPVGGSDGIATRQRHRFSLTQAANEVLSACAAGLQIEDADTGLRYGAIFKDGIAVFEPWVFHGEEVPADSGTAQPAGFSVHCWQEAWYRRVGFGDEPDAQPAGPEKPDPAPARTANAPVRLAIVIPTINRADLLRESILALIPQSEGVERIFVIDNGRQSLDFPTGKVEVLEQAENLGVAASWNLGIRRALECPSVTHVLVLNDDIEMGETQVESISRVLAGSPETWMFVGPYYWSVWALAREGALAMADAEGKLFDEAFFPAYYEDNDFYYRFMWRYPDRYRGDVSEMIPHVQRNSMSIAADPSLNTRFVANGRYYSEKWGGPPGHERVPVGGSLPRRRSAGGAGH